MYSFEIPGTISIHKPLFLPWIPFIARIACSEMFVPLDDVQYRKRYFDNRTHIVQWKSEQQFLWVTLEVQQPHLNCMRDVTVKCDATRVINMLESNYSATPHFSECWPVMLEALSEIKPGDNIFQVNINLLRAFFGAVDIQFPEVIPSSKIYSGSDRSDRIITISEKTEKSIILNGWGKSTEVHDVERINAHGLRFVTLNKSAVLERINNNYLREGLTAFHILCIKGKDEVLNSIDRIREVYLSDCL